MSMRELMDTQDAVSQEREKWRLQGERDRVRNENDRLRLQKRIDELLAKEATTIVKLDAADARINELVAECRSRLDHENRQRARADKAEAELIAYRAECQEAHLTASEDTAKEMERLRAQVAAGDALREAVGGVEAGRLYVDALAPALDAYDAAKGAA